MITRDNFDKLVAELRAEGYSSICCWQPLRSVAGGAVYFSGIAQMLSDYTDLNIYYMDVPDGYARTLLRNNTKVQFLEYKQQDWFFPIKEKTIIIVNSTRPIQLKNMNPKNKILVFHPDTTEIGWHLLYFFNENKKLMRLFEKTNAIVFQDWPCRDLLNRYIGTNFQNKNYFQVTVPPVSNKLLRSCLVNRNEINAVWLGRLAPDKTSALFNVIKYFSALKTEKKKRLHIIGDGVSNAQVRRFCAENAKKLDVVFTGTLFKERLPEPSNQPTLDDYLIKNADIVFAMGTSALEGSKLGIPSAVVYSDNRTYDVNEFFWLYDMTEYCVGMTVAQKNVTESIHHSIEEICGAISDDNGFREIGGKCHHYYLENHSDRTDLAYKLLRYSIETTCTFEKVKSCLKYIPYNNLILEEFRTARLRFYVKITHGKRTIYKLFGLPILEKELISSDHTVYKLFGKIRYTHKYLKKGHVFRTEKFKG